MGTEGGSTVPPHRHGRRRCGGKQTASGGCGCHRVIALT